VFSKKKSKKGANIIVKEDVVLPIEENLVDEVPGKVVENVVGEESTVETDKSETGSANNADITMDSEKDEVKTEEVEDEGNKEVVKEEPVEEDSEEEENQITISKSSHEEDRKESDFHSNEELDRDLIIHHRSSSVDVEENLSNDRCSKMDETEKEGKTTDSAADPGLFCGCF